MKETLDIRDIHIPDGVLHDQKLKSVSFVKGELTLAFDVKLYEQNYTDKNYYDKFKDYKTCTVRAGCENDDIGCRFTGMRRNGKIVGRYVDLNEFIDCVNNKEIQMEYLETLVSGAPEIDIELSVYTRFRKYKKMHSAFLCIPTDKLIFEWE